jgi:hypothetical protein
MRLKLYVVHGSHPCAAPAVRAGAPVIARMASHLNRTDDDVARGEMPAGSLRQ